MSLGGCAGGAMVDGGEVEGEDAGAAAVVRVTGAPRGASTTCGGGFVWEPWRTRWRTVTAPLSIPRFDRHVVVPFRWWWCPRARRVLDFD
jgi:hypothetical protein